MEYVEGVNLYEQPPKDIEGIIAVMQQICVALAHAHEHGIIHRDLKPENVILITAGKVKLMDFGLARSISSSLTSEGIILGTVFYIAPEQAQGKPIDPRSDLYSLGVMLYELTTGELPFTAEDPLAVVSQHIHAPVVPPRAKSEQIPPALEALILNLMAKDPKDRPASALEVFEQLSSPEMVDRNAQPAKELTVLDRIVRGRIVGRQDEIREARHMWQQAMAGWGQLLLISGEPGVGKTRLMREIVTQAKVFGGAGMIGRSYAEGDPPYSPFRQILREALNVSKELGIVIPTGVLSDLLTIAPELQFEFPDLPNRDLNGTEKQQQRLFDQFLYFVNLFTKFTPVLFVLEDVHWADASSLRLLRFLARNTRSQRMMILATYRGVELDEARALHETLLDFQRERIGMRLRLKNLNRLETEEMLGILFAEEITPDFLEGIYHETDGNPFFIEEVCKAIIESGKVTFEKGRWKRPPNMEDVGVPQSIQVAIQSRLRILSENAQKILEQAAIIGREFDFCLLQRALNTDEDSLLDALDEALKVRLVQQVKENGEEKFEFVHAIIQTTIMASLRTLRRRRLHRRAAMALEALEPEGYEALAYHFIEAGETDQGVDYLIKAGDRAREMFAHEEAIDCYKQAFDHLIEGEKLAQAARTLMKLGMTYHSDFQLTKACHAYDQAFNLYQQVGKLDKVESPPKAPQILRILLGEPSSLDPNLGVGHWSEMIYENLFSGLVELSPEWEIVPEVAHRWDVLDGGRRYVFYLREDFTWSDGVPVTADDFAYAWKRAIDPASEIAEVNLYFIITNAEAFHLGEVDWKAVGVCAKDDFTLEVELESPSISFLYLLSIYHLFPLPRHVIKKHGADWMNPENLVTNGPYRLVEWNQGISIHFEASPSYPGRFPGNAKQLVWYFFRADMNREDALRMYEENQIDAIWLGYVPHAKRVRLQYADEFLTAPTTLVDYWSFNTEQPPFDDARVRKALGLAIDRENLINSIYEGGGIFPATGGLLSPAMPGHTEGLVLPYDPSEARRLLAEAGYPGGNGFPVIKALFMGPKMNKFLETQWQENLGIKIRWIELSLEKFHEQQWHEDLHVWLWEDWPRYPAPELLLDGPGLKITGWFNQKFHELIQLASEMMDYEKRLDLFRQAEEILIDEVPVLPISYRRYDYLYKPWVRIVPYSPSKGWYWKEYIIEPH
jgi:ABC-type oligopeptide transport system substrate-binding subunit